MQCRALRDGFGDCTPTCTGDGVIKNPFEKSGCCITKERLREGLCRATQEKNGGCTKDNDCQGTLRCDTKEGKCGRPLTSMVVELQGTTHKDVNKKSQRI